MPLIHCSSIDDVAWHIPSHPLEDNGAHIYRLQLSSGAAHIAKAGAVLSKDETARAARYIRQMDRERFILTRAALRLILSNYIGIPAANIVFTIGVNKKPFVPRAGKIQYNVSHAGDWAVIGIANSPLGVDVEVFNPQYDYLSVLDMCFAPDEIGYIKSSPDPLNAFYQLWTRKEALVKATSKGMDDDFKFVPSMDGGHTVPAEKIGSTTDWNIVSLPLAEQHIASLAYDPAIETISFFEADELLKQL